MIDGPARDPLFSPLQAILDVDVAARAGWTPPDLLLAFLDGGATFVQVRAKQLASGPLLELCDRLVHAAQPYGAALIVNDRPDIARMSGAAGVHLGQEDLPPAAARELLGDGAIIGFSTHVIDQIEAALHEPISYLAVGPVFGTATKDTGYSAVGLDLVRTAVRLAGRLPVIGIGGVTVDNAASVIAAGAASVAVIGDLLVGGDPIRRTEAFLRSLARDRV